jgi:hypothetical protein
MSSLNCQNYCPSIVRRHPKTGELEWQTIDKCEEGCHCADPIEVFGTPKKGTICGVTPCCSDGNGNGNGNFTKPIRVRLPKGVSFIIETY